MNAQNDYCLKTVGITYSFIYLKHGNSIIHYTCMLRTPIVALLLLLTSYLANGQAVMPEVVHVDPTRDVTKTPTLFFEHITLYDGLPAGNTHPLFRDSRGFLWLNSWVGLLRYDGYTFKVFRDTADHTFGGRIFTTSIAEDAKGALWLNTSNGLKRLSPQTWTFTTFRNKAGKSYAFSCVHMDKNQRIWVGTEGDGLWALDQRRGIFTSFQSQRVQGRFTGLANSLHSPEEIGKIVEDPTGVLWMSGNSGTISGLFSFDPLHKSWTFYPYPSTIASHKKLNNLGIYDLCVDPDNPYLWLATYSGQGLLRFDAKKHSWKSYVFIQASGQPSSENVVHTARPKQKGQLWIGTQKGNFVFDIAKERFIRYNHHADDPTTLPQKNGYCFLTDQQGISWFSSTQQSRAISKVVPQHQLRHNPSFFEGDKIIETIWKNPVTGDVFYGVDKLGQCLDPFIVKVAGKGGQVIVRPCPEIPEIACNRNSIRSLCGDPSGAFIWVLTGVGLFHLDPESLALKPINEKIANAPEITTRDIRFTKVVIDQTGNVWLGSREAGLFKFDRRTGKYSLFSNLQDGADGIPPRIGAMLCDRKGQIWISRGKAGIARYSQKAQTFKYFKPQPGDSTSLQSGYVYGFAQTSDGKIWVAHMGGICCIDPDDQLRQVKIQTNLSPHFIVADMDDNLWISTLDDQLLKYQPQTRKTRILDAQNGLIIKDPDDCLYVAADGELFYADQYRWKPEDLPLDSTPFQLVFTGFQIFEKDAFLEQDLNYLKKIVLQPGQNFFSIAFAALSLANPTRNSYAYQLQGVDPNWVECGTRHKASYTNLAPGEYTFRVKGANEDGVWSTKPIALEIQILPAWWQTLWFKIILALLVLTLGTIFYKQRLARVRADAHARQKNAELQQVQAEFRQRLAETEMTALRAQMNPHFLFNVMNSINRYLLDNDAETASVYLTKFSRLIRLVLENSRSEMVTLENELEALRLYIEMEALRFKQKVQYHIEVDPNIDRKFTLIPPLLMQPFVENAIWHGLLHKETGGMVTIRVQQPEESKLRVLIIDNGIGRSAAAALQSKSAQRHKSFGLRVTLERIQAVNELYQTNTRVEIRDVLNPDGSAGGTEVMLEIPI